MTGMRILFLYLGNSTLGKIRLSPMTLLTDGIVNNGSFLGSLDSVAVHARKIGMRVRKMDLIDRLC